MREKRSQPMIPKAVLESLKGSGFPFQTAVAHVIRSSEGWKVYASEYPWRSRNGDDQFLDIIAQKGMLFLTIECKKTRHEILTFLRPSRSARVEHDVPDFRCLHIMRRDKISELEVMEARVVGRPVRQAHVFCETWAVGPNSPNSEFCVVATSKEGRDRRLLERDAAMLIGATDEFAEDIRKRLDTPELPPQLHPAYLVFPVIVTNAKLYTTRYNPSEISLESGEIGDLPKETEEAPWVRFSKAFTSSAGYDYGFRSIFVVSAPKFQEFLNLLERSPEQLHRRSVRVI